MWKISKSLCIINSNSPPQEMVQFYFPSSDTVTELGEKWRKWRRDRTYQRYFHEIRRKIDRSLAADSDCVRPGNKSVGENRAINSGYKAVPLPPMARAFYDPHNFHVFAFIVHRDVFLQRHFPMEFRDWKVRFRGCFDTFFGGFLFFDGYFWSKICLKRVFQVIIN